MVASARFIVVHMSVSDAHHVKVVDATLEICEALTSLGDVGSLS